MTFLIRLFVALPAVLLAITPLKTLAEGGWPKSEKDVALLPAYCKATQIIRDVSKLPRASMQALIDSYIAEYGPIYNHLHHYCLALLQESYGDTDLGKSNYHYALQNIDYVLNKNPPSSFPLLPEIYTSRGRILLKQGKPGAAVADLMKAIALKPDYEPAYLQLSELYLTAGKKGEAISILEKGVEKNPSPSRLLKRLERLGKPYKGTPGSALAKQQATDLPPPGSIVSPPAPSGSNGRDQPAPRAPSDGATGPGADPAQSDPNAAAPPAIGKPGNPYCRFCP